MIKKLRRTLSLTLAIAMVFSLLPTGNYVGNKAVQAATNLSSFDDDDSIDTNVIPDTHLLQAIKVIVGGSETADVKFGELKAYNGAVDLTPYTDIADVSGLGYMVNASSMDLHALTKVTKIYDNEFGSCKFRSFEMAPNVKEIGKSAFYNCKNLETIDLPEGLTKIWAQAFESCTKLDGIVLPDGIEKIGNQAFANCESLSAIVIPDGINAATDNSGDDSVNGIGSNVFANCSSLSSVTIGAGMTAIPTGFLSGADDLVSIDIPAKISSIGDNAFSATSLLKIDLSANTSLTEIGNAVFDNCHFLYEVKLPDSIMKLGNGSFAFCDSIMDITWLEDLPNLKVIGDNAFEGTAFTSVTIPGTVETIGSRAFEKNTDLETVTILDFDTIGQDSVKKTIGASAFADDSRLSKVVLPTKNEDSVNESIEILDGAFSNCYSLSNINFPASITSIGANAFYGCGTNCTDWSDTKDIYEGEYKGVAKYVLPGDVTKVDANAEDAVLITSKDLPEFYQPAYASISKYAKSSDEGAVRILCQDENGTSNIHIQLHTGLTEVDLSRCRELELGEAAFSNCYQLETVKLPDCLTNIPNNAFAYCYSEKMAGDGGTLISKLKNYATEQWKFTGLTSVTMGNNITSIGDNAFIGCKALVLGGLPSKLVRIGKNAFDGCESLGDVEIPSKVEVIDDYAFANTSRVTTDKEILSGYGLTSCDVASDSSLKRIGSNAFESSAISSFLMNESAGVRKIETKTFNNCQRLKTVRLSKAVQYVSGYVFSANIRLKSLDIPDKCTLHKDAFLGKVQIKEMIDRGGDSFYAADTNYYTNKFVLNISPVETAFSVMRNSKVNLPLVTIPTVGNSTYKSVKIGDHTYNWDKDNEVYLGENTDTYMFPSAYSEKKKLEKTDYNAALTYDASGIAVEGKKEGKNIAVNIEQELKVYVDTNTYLTLSPTVTYYVDVTANPCTSIVCNDKIYMRYDSTSEKTITPEFIGQNSEMEISDDISWEVEAGNDIISMVPSDDLKTAKIKVLNSNRGTARIKLKAGSVEKTIFVYSVAPAKSIRVYKDGNQVLSSVDMSSESLTDIEAEINYGTDEEIGRLYPDALDISSSDPAVVQVQSIKTEDGRTKCQFVSHNPGQAKVTFLSLASGNKTVINVNVISPTCKPILQNYATNESIEAGGTFTLRAKTSTSLTSYIKYTFNETLSDKTVNIHVDNPDILDASCVITQSTGLARVAITGKKTGKTNITIYPTVGNINNNGITIQVEVKSNVDYINLAAKTIYVGNTESVFTNMSNVFSESITTASDANYQSITDNRIVWTSSDEECAEVDAYGNVTAKKVPKYKTVTITATAYDGETVAKKQSVSVTINSVKPALKTVEGTDVRDGSTLVLQGTEENTLICSYGAAEVENALLYTTTDASIADVTITEKVIDGSTKNEIVIKGKKKGTATITFYAEGGIPETEGVKINVKVEADVAELVLEDQMVSIGNTKSVFVSMKNSIGQETTEASADGFGGITDNTIEFISEKEDCASVDQYGNVTAIKMPTNTDTVTITANVYKDGTLIKTVTANVTLKSVKTVITDENGNDIKDESSVALVGTGEIRFLCDFLDDMAGQSIRYSVGDSNIATAEVRTVTVDGVQRSAIFVKGKAKGTTTVNIYPADGDASLDGIVFDVVVQADITALELNDDTLYLGNTTNLVKEATNSFQSKITNGNDLASFCDNRIEWVVSDPQSVVVDEKGNATVAKLPTDGKVTITANVYRGETFLFAKSVQVTVKLAELQLTDASGTAIADNATVEVDGTNDLTIYYDFKENVASKDIDFVVGNENVVAARQLVQTVGGVTRYSIILTGKVKGNTTVVVYPSVATANDGITLNVSVKADLTNIQLKNINLTEGDSGSVFVKGTNCFNQTVTAESLLTFADITDNTVVWSSSDSESVSVNEYGTVVAKKVPNGGSATITAAVYKKNETTGQQMKVLESTAVVTVADAKPILKDSYGNFYQDGATITLTNSETKKLYYTYNGFIANKTPQFDYEDASVCTAVAGKEYVGLQEEQADIITISGKKKGSSKITAYPAGGVKAKNAITLNVVIKADVADIELVEQEIYVGKSASVFAKVVNTFGQESDLSGLGVISGNEIEWESGDSQYVTVDNNGNVTAKKATPEGGIQITATAYDGNRYVTSKSVTVVVRHSKIVVKDSEGNTLENNGTVAIRGTESNAFTYTIPGESNADIVYSAVNSGLLTISNSTKNGEANEGTIYFKGKTCGTTTVTIYPKNGNVEDNGIVLRVSVNSDIETIELIQKTFKVGETAPVLDFMNNAFGEEVLADGLVQYSDITDNRVEWSVSNVSYASVDDFGNVTVKRYPKNGTITVTVTIYKDEEVFKTESVELTVKDPNAVETTTSKDSSTGGQTVKPVTKPVFNPNTKVSLKKVKAAKKSAKLSWKKAANATGYEIYMSVKTKKKFKKVAVVRGAAKLTYVKKKLKRKKKYFFKVRAFGPNAAGKTVYGKWSKVKAVKIKK